MRKVTSNYIVIRIMKRPAHIVEYFLNYYGIKYYKKACPDSFWCDELNKENKRILPFILYFTGAEWEPNINYYWNK